MKIHLASALCGMHNLGLIPPHPSHPCWDMVRHVDAPSVRMAVYVIAMTVTTEEDHLELIINEARSWWSRLRKGDYGKPSALNGYESILDME